MGLKGGPAGPRDDGFYVTGWVPGAIVPPGTEPDQPWAQAVEYRGGTCVWQGPKHYEGSKRQREADAREDITVRKAELQRAVEGDTKVVFTGTLDEAFKTLREMEDDLPYCGCVDILDFVEQEVKVLRVALDAARREAAQARAEVEVIVGHLNTPEVHDFMDGARREAWHQRVRWPSSHDSGKTPADWFWLVGYLAGKALTAHVAGNTEKALHHTISTAAALCNWHAAVLGRTNMRPGIEPPNGYEEGTPA